MTETSISKQPEAAIVLYLSDDATFLNSARRTLGQAGFSVVTTRSSAEAIDLIDRSEIDAVLCDYDLPNMDALAFFEKMKRHRKDAAPPLLVLGAQNADMLRTRCKAAGTQGFWDKAQSPESLIETVTAMIRDERKRNHIVVVSSRRKVQGSTDPLTQVATREHFLRRLNGESLASYRDQNNLSLLMLIIDRHEELAQSYGKPKADGAIAQTARLIEGELRSRDCVARYDEQIFAIALPDTNVQAASAVARRLRRRIGTTEFGDLDLSLTVTVSVGVSNRPPGMKTHPEDLITQALHAARAAQTMGGNRILADTALTGFPVILVVGDPNAEIGAIARGLEGLNVEVRQATSFTEAHEKLGEIPVAMVMTDHQLPGNGDGNDLLEWVRNQFPAIKRVLVSERADIALMTKAINRAQAHYFIATPWNLSLLPAVVDELLFS